MIIFIFFICIMTKGYNKKKLSWYIDLIINVFNCSFVSSYQANPTPHRYFMQLMVQNQYSTEPINTVSCCVRKQGNIIYLLSLQSRNPNIIGTFAQCFQNFRINLRGFRKKITRHLNTNIVAERRENREKSGSFLVKMQLRYLFI